MSFAASEVSVRRRRRASCDAGWRGRRTLPQAEERASLPSGPHRRICLGNACKRKEEKMGEQSAARFGSAQDFTGTPTKEGRVQGTPKAGKYLDKSTHKPCTQIKKAHITHDRLWRVGRSSECLRRSLCPWEGASSDGSTLNSKQLTQAAGESPDLSVPVIPPLVRHRQCPPRQITPWWQRVSLGQKGH